MGLSERLRRLDDRVIGEAAPPAETSTAMERRCLLLAVTGVVGAVLALVLAGDGVWGSTLAMLSLAMLGSPYVDVRVRRWLRR